MRGCPFTLIACFIAVLATTPALAADDDLELAFNNHCRECHSALKGDNRLGPTLYGVVGRKAATVPGYEYSPALQDSGITWTEKVLDQWIADPSAVASGNNMQPPYPGVADPAERAKIIAYLKSDTNTPAPGAKSASGAAMPAKPTP
jgi:cytochrome c